MSATAASLATASRAQLAASTAPTGDRGSLPVRTSVPAS